MAYKTMAYKTKKYRKKRLRGGRTINENMEMLYITRTLIRMPRSL